MHVSVSVMDLRIYTFAIQGFVITSHQFDFEGLPEECQASLYDSEVYVLQMNINNVMVSVCQHIYCNSDFDISPVVEGGVRYHFLDCEFTLYESIPVSCHQRSL